MSALEQTQVPAPRPAVLVVEDEFLIRLAIVESLRDHGIETLEADNADEAMTIIEATPGLPVVFTDVRMPGAMDGFALARWIAERHPAIRTILTSGEIGSAAVPANFHWQADFVAKPYRLDEVAARLAALAAK